jgi:hypothetical protein
MSVIEELIQLCENITQDIKELYGKAKPHPLAYLTIIFLFIIALVSLIFIPPYQVSRINDTNITEKVKQENQDRATLAQIFGGVAIGIGLYYTWRRNIISQEGQITERFTRAVNQLGAIDRSGNPAIEIRLGGIYALERISTESEKDY